MSLQQALCCRLCASVWKESCRIWLNGSGDAMPRDRTNERLAKRKRKKKEGALEDKEKSGVGEGKWARYWRITRASLPVTIGQTLIDAAASVNACVRGRQTVPVSNVLETFLQNNMTCWVTFHKYMFWFSLSHCLCAWHYSFLCCLSASSSICVCISLLLHTHHTVRRNRQGARVLSSSCLAHTSLSSCATHANGILCSMRWHMQKSPTFIKFPYEV